MNNILKQKNTIFSVETKSNVHIKLLGRLALSHIDYCQNLSSIRELERDTISSSLNINPENIIFLNQTHGDTVFTLDKVPQKTQIFYGNGDGLITQEMNLALVIRTADCVPVMLFDKKINLISAVHSGWKGTELKIAQKAAKIMINEYGSSPDNIQVIILPSIGPDSYIVNTDVSNRFPKHFKVIDDKIYLNLWSSITESLTDLNISIKNIKNTNICNLMHKKDFFTHRGGDAGRNLNIIYIKK